MPLAIFVFPLPGGPHKTNRLTPDLFIAAIVAKASASFATACNDPQVVSNASHLRCHSLLSGVSIGLGEKGLLGLDGGSNRAGSVLVDASVARVRFTDSVIRSMGCPFDWSFNSVEPVHESVFGRVLPLHRAPVHHFSKLNPDVYPRIGGVFLVLRNDLLGSRGRCLRPYCLFFCSYILLILVSVHLLFTRCSIAVHLLFKPLVFFP